MAKLSEDKINFVFTAESSELQQEIHKTTKRISDLTEEHKDLLAQQAAMKRARMTETKEYRALTRQIKEKAAAIKDEKQKLDSLHKELGVNAMTMAQLRKEAKHLQKQLDNTSKALNPEAYKEIETRLQCVKDRMKELSSTASQVSTSMGGGGGFWQNFMKSGIDAGGLKTMLLGSGTFAVFAMFFEQIAKMGKDIFQKAKLFYDFSIEIEEARRLTREFIGVEGQQLTELSSSISAISKQTGHEYKEVLNSVDTLINQYGITWQQAIDVIKDGIQAGADENGTFFSQIQQYAPAFRDAGVEVQDLVALITQTRSGIFNEQGMALIQTATERIRRFSTQTQKALDGIGIDSQKLAEDLASGDKSIVQAIQLISQRITELPENSQQVGEVLKNVFGKTASNEGMKMIETIASITTNMDELKNVTGEYGRLEREQIEVKEKLNQKMTELFGIGQGGFKELTAKAEIFIVKGLLKILGYMEKAYDELGAVRAFVEILRYAFLNLFSVVELGFNLIIDSAKGTIKFFRAFAEILEGIFTLDFSKIEKGFADYGNAVVNTFKEAVGDAMKFGEDWGDHFVDGVNRVFKKKKVETNELPEVTVTGRRKKKTPPPDPDATPSRPGSSRSGSNTLEREQQKADQEEIKQFNKARQEEVEAENRAYQQRINNLRLMLTNKQLSQERYNLLEQAAGVQHTTKILAIETDYARKAEEIALHDAEKKTELQASQNRNVENAQQKSFDAQLAAQKAFLDSMQKMQSITSSNRKTKDLDKLKADMDAQLLVLDGYYQASLEYARQNNLNLLDVEKAYQEARQAIIDSYAQKEKKLQDDNAAHRLQIREKYGLASQQEIFNAELEQLKAHLQEEEITQEEYENAVAKMKRDKWKESFDYYHQLFGDAVSALQDAELANVDAKYDAEIEAARQAGKDTTDLENKKANEQLKIQKKYADVNFAIKASQIIADTATSIMKAFADLGPIAGAVAAALMGVTGAAQLAAANAERQKVKRMTLKGASATGEAGGARVATGLEEGGSIDVERRQDGKKFHALYEPRRRGFIDHPTVIVGEGPEGKSREWVASNDAVNNPTLSPLIDALDRAQRAKSIRTFDLRRWVMARFPGKDSGGFIDNKQQSSVNYAATASQPSQATQQPDNKLLSQLTTLLQKINDEGIPAYVLLSDLEDKQQLRNRARNIARKP